MGFEIFVCVWNTHVHKKRVHFLSFGAWDPTPHYLNRNHVLLLFPLNFVFKIPSEETEDVLRVLLEPWSLSREIGFMCAWVAWP